MVFPIKEIVDQSLVVFAGRCVRATTATTTTTIITTIFFNAHGLYDGIRSARTASPEGHDFPHVALVGVDVP